MARSAILNVMTSAAIKAGKSVLRDFGELDKLQVSRKGTANFATAADKRAEKLLHQELSKARPSCGFLMEESGELAGSDPTHRFVIDPIDGTHNFIHAIPYFCIAIAYEKQLRDGTFETQAGVIFDPLRNELFCAELHQGATMNDQRLIVSGRSEPDTCMVATFMPPADPQSHGARLHRALGMHPYSMRSAGAAALDLAYVAAGRYDAAFYLSCHHWDIAAGALMVREAGGKVMGGAERLFFASNPLIHDKMAAALSAA